MTFHPLPYRSPLDHYLLQAAGLLAALGERDPAAVRFFHQNHPRFLDAKVPWLPRPLEDAAIERAALTLPDAQLALARWYSFLNWDALAAYVGEVTRDGEVFAFESAVEAVISGGLDALRASLRERPDLVRARSTRVTHHDPNIHRATLLHYVAANGVENHRQRTPPNAVQIARTLLEAGSDPDALAGMYGGNYATLSLLVSSSHPAQAGLQEPLVDLLADFGATLDPLGSEKWGSPLLTALAFGYLGAARALVRRGARVDSLPAAAGLGDVARTREWLAASGPDSRHRALALAAQLGHADVVALLLDAGEDPDRFNPDGIHSHSTPLHQAALAGRLPVVRLLVERGARLDIRDSIFGGTPLGWALHAGRGGIADYLRSRGAK